MKKQKLIATFLSASILWGSTGSMSNAVRNNVSNTQQNQKKVVLDVFEDEENENNYEISVRLDPIIDYPCFCHFSLMPYVDKTDSHDLTVLDGVELDTNSFNILNELAWELGEEQYQNEDGACQEYKERDGRHTLQNYLDSLEKQKQIQDYANQIFSNFVNHQIELRFPNN